MAREAKISTDEARCLGQDFASGIPGGITDETRFLNMLELIRLDEAEQYQKSLAIRSLQAVRRNGLGGWPTRKNPTVFELKMVVAEKNEIRNLGELGRAFIRGFLDL